MEIPLRKYWEVQKKYLAPFKKKVIILALLLSTGTVLQLVVPFIIKNYIKYTDGTTITSLDLTERFQLLKILAVIYIVFNLILYSITALSSFVGQDLAWSSTNKIRYDLTEHCLNLDMTFHNKYKPGEMIERVDGDINTLASFLSQFSIQLVTSVLLLFGIIIAVFIEHWIFGLIFLGYTVLAIAVFYFLRNFTVKFWEKARQKSSELMGTIEESLNATEDVNATGAKSYIMRKFFASSRGHYKAFRKAIIREQFFVVAIWGLIALIYSMVYAPSVPLFANAEIELGTIILMDLFAFLILMPIFTITRQMQMLQQAGASLDRVNKLFTLKTKIEDQGTKDIQPGPISIEFEDVHFSYIENEKVLNDVSFNLEAGKILGVVGHTGSGKTTISRLLFRLYDVADHEGKISINGSNIKDIKLRELRENISYVTQNIELFQASLRENITFFDSRIKDERINQVLFDLEMEELVKRFPEGLDTTIVSGEEGLSAGEAQLLALTRAFLKKPNLVVLDEASSRLDPATELLIEKAIDKLLLNRTGIIIAHRLATLQRVDKILILDKGKIIEYGERAELAKDSTSYFYKLLQTGEISEVLK